MHDAGIIYRASRLVNWSVKLKTTISNLEVDNKIINGRTLLTVPDYKDKIEFGVLIYIAYPVIDSNTNERIIVATTRPETLFGDVAIAIHPEDSRYKHLHGKFVQHPLIPKKIPIILDATAVDMTFGTGAVKITPAHDQNDYNVGKRHSLQFVNIFTDDGLLNENCGSSWEGLKRFDARQLVIDELKRKGFFMKQEDNPMIIPLCSRSGDVIEPLLKPQWWVSQKSMAKTAIDIVEKGEIRFSSSNTKNDYFRWLENIQDWCISRQLWWGHRCPVYFINVEGSEDSAAINRNDGKYWVAGRNLEEAVHKAAKKFPNKKFSLEQDQDVLDTWFSSALWPFSTLGWPNKTNDMNLFYPFSMLETGWDILFFWVTRMIMLGVKLTGSIPFKEVYCHSLVRDFEGRKMSKSLGNVIDPLDIINGCTLKELHEKLQQGNLDPKKIDKMKIEQKKMYPRGIPQCGSDALRFALCAYTTGGRDINLDISRVEGYRKFCNKIYQATKFSIQRLGDDYQPPSSTHTPASKSLVEKWILYQMNNTIAIVNDSFEKRDFLTCTSKIYELWYMICDVYIENFKWLANDTIMEKAAKDTLHTLIENGLKMIHPFMPYLSEELWQRLPDGIGKDESSSIMKTLYPTPSEDFNYGKEAKQYDEILKIIKSMRSLLSEYNITANARFFFEILDDELFDIVRAEKDAILSVMKGVENISFLAVAPDRQPIKNDCVSCSISSQVNVYLLVKGQYKDISKELSKQLKQLEKLNNIYAATQRMLTNKDFIKKASEEIREMNEKKLINIHNKILGMQNTVNNLKRFQE